MGLFNFKFGFGKKEKFAMNKSDVMELSDREKEIISEHREKMKKLERDHVHMQEVMNREMERIIPTLTGTDAEKEVYLYDILGGWNQGDNIVRAADLIVNPQNPDATSLGGQIAATSEITLAEPKRYKPIEVVGELERVPDVLSMENLEDKIKILEMKKELLQNNRYAKNEIIDMIDRIKNRRRYDEFKEFYEQFDNTTTEKIIELVSKYKLVLKSSELFIAAFPDDAVMIMRSYVDNTVALCGKKPLFYVIAEEQMFKEEYKKKDPILLAQSPFGCYWQILGAWDKEMILLQEL